MKLSVEEVQYEKDKNIVIRFAGDDLSFLITNGFVSVYMNEDIADKLVFQLGALLQDRKIPKK